MIAATPFVVRGRCKQLASRSCGQSAARELVARSYIHRPPPSRFLRTTQSWIPSRADTAHLNQHYPDRTSTRNMSALPTKKDWSATQYLKFGNERTRPVHDLIAQIAPRISTPNPRIYDLGCGPGNSTKVLLEAFPTARITGMDSSPDMLSKASASLPGIEFVQGDLAAFAPKEGEQVDLFYSNAVFHWLRNPTRIETLTRLFQTLKPGGVLAFQVPDNYHEPSHALMRDVARREDAPWAPFFKDTRIGDFQDKGRPDLDPIEPGAAFYNALAPHAEAVDMWTTKYSHVLKDAPAIVEWVKGTGLQPYLQRIEDEATKKLFLGEYEERLREAYPALVDGKVLLGYPRLFVLAVRK
ncbi:methyltransferase type 11 [Stagonosporopsis vannaccii]|nr:methyltransferase type 11 [Stagonosporopsis vannaccii]